MGSTILYLAVDSPHFETRRAALASSRILTNLFPTTFNLVMRDSFNAILSRVNKATTEITQEQVLTRQRRLSSLIATCTAFDDNVESTLREELLSELLILCHHPEICPIIPLSFNCISDDMQVITRANCGLSSSSAPNLTRCMWLAKKWIGYVRWFTST